LRRFNKIYFALAMLLFIIEVLIALFVRDGFVRPYLGDVFVVILIYCFIKSFLDVPVFPLAVAVLIFAFIIEFLQYVKIVEKLGLEKSEIARTIIGTSFVWIDVLAYVVGIVIVLAVENYRLRIKAVR
jgi:Protein of unknown function (DUF2809)